MIEYKKEQPSYSVYGRSWVKNSSGNHYTDAYGRVIAQIDTNSFKETYTVYTVDYENNRELIGVYLSIRDAKRETERLLGTPDGHLIAPCLYCGGHENIRKCPVRMFDWPNHFMLGNIRTTGT